MYAFYDMLAKHLCLLHNIVEKKRGNTQQTKKESNAIKVHFP